MDRVSRARGVVLERVRGRSTKNRSLGWSRSAGAGRVITYESLVAGFSSFFLYSPRTIAPFPLKAALVKSSP
jgi:hypothetical protein